MSVISALLAAEHDLTVLDGCVASDRPDLAPQDRPCWTIDHSATLALIVSALDALGVSRETGRECESCRNRPSRTPA